MAAPARYMALFLLSATWLLFMALLVLWIFEYMEPGRTIEIALLCVSISGCISGILAALCLSFNNANCEVQYQAVGSEVEDDGSRERGPTSSVEFYENMQMARLAFASSTVLPPFKTFKSSDETEDECAVCLEDFKVGELVQSFPCKHEFHASCINSWLLAGNITCPVCRFSIRGLLEAQGFLRKSQ